MRNNIFLYYLDYEVQTLFGLDDPRQIQYKDVYKYAELITKLAILLCNNTLILPASNYLESDLGFNLINAMNPSQYTDDIFLNLVSSSYNLSELIEKKKIAHGENINRKGYHYAEVSDPDSDITLPGVMIKRENSASVDIRKAWLSDEGRHRLGETIYNKFPHFYQAGELDQLLGDVPDKLGGLAFIGRYITPLFVKLPKGQKNLENLVNSFITREYIRSFLDEFDAACISDIPLFNSGMILPTESKYQHLSYYKYRQLLKEASYKEDSAWKYVVHCNTEGLLLFKQSDCWRRIIEPTVYDMNVYLGAIRGGDNMNAVDQNLKEFWDRQGEELVEKYKSRLSFPIGKGLPVENLNDKLGDCEFLILTANSVEDAMITRELMASCSVEKPEKITDDCQLYQFFTLKGHALAHIVPQRTSSFTTHGSADAVRSALAHIAEGGKKNLKAVFSLGVAYGKSPKTKTNKELQDLGDVLVSNRIIRWDAFIKNTDGKLNLNDEDFLYIGDEILGGCKEYLKNSDLPRTEEAGIGEFRWFLGTLLSGNMVLSDADFKQALLEAVAKFGNEENIIGGEMEGSGICYECRRKAVPVMIIKGICDWGENKNGWDFVSKDKNTKDLIKDCVQAYACENAFKTFEFIISQVYGEK